MLTTRREHQGRVYSSLIFEVAPAPIVLGGGTAIAITGALVLAVLAWAMLFGLQQFYTYTIGAALHGLSVVLDKVPLIHLGSRTVGAIDDFVQAQIGKALSNAEANVARTWHALAWTVRMTAYSVELLAHSTLDAIHALSHAEIPAAITTRITPVTKAVTNVTKVVGVSIADVRRLLRAQAISLEADLARTFGLARNGIDALQRVSIPGLRREVAAAEAGVASLGHGLDIAKRRIGHLERRQSEAVFGALVAGALATLGVSWTRRSCAKRTADKFCRVNPSVLDDLLGGLLLIAGSVSLVNLAQGMQDVTEEVTEAARAFIREATAVDSGNPPAHKPYGVELAPPPGG